MSKQKNVGSDKKVLILGILFFVVVVLFWYILILQPQLNNSRISMPAKVVPQYVEATPTPRPTPITSVGQRYVSKSQRITLDVPSGWKINDDEWLEGSVIGIQGPKQNLRIYENVQPDHGFDDFTLQNSVISVSGKSFTAKKFTSSSWGSSFVSAHIQDKPYLLYIEYGDAASWGFNGFDQKYEEKVDFEKDVLPVETMLKTLTY